MHTVTYFTFPCPLKVDQMKLKLELISLLRRFIRKFALSNVEVFRTFQLLNERKIRLHPGPVIRVHQLNSQIVWVVCESSNRIYHANIFSFRTGKLFFLHFIFMNLYFLQGVVCKLVVKLLLFLFECVRHIVVIFSNFSPFSNYSLFSLVSEITK